MSDELGVIGDDINRSIGEQNRGDEEVMGGTSRFCQRH